MSIDLSHGIEDMARLIYWHVGVWHDLGYEDPPTPDSKTIPPLGQRSPEAIKGARDAIEGIGQLTSRLSALHSQIVRELWQDEAARAVLAAEAAAYRENAERNDRA